MCPNPRFELFWEGMQCSSRGTNGAFHVCSFILRMQKCLRFYRDGAYSTLGTLVDTNIVLLSVFSTANSPSSLRPTMFSLFSKPAPETCFSSFDFLLKGCLKGKLDIYFTSYCFSGHLYSVNWTRKHDIDGEILHKRRHPVTLIC